MKQARLSITVSSIAAVVVALLVYVSVSYTTGFSQFFATQSIFFSFLFRDNCPWRCMPTPPPPGPTKPPVPEGQLPSFPGATGFGATTPGGRGGQVIYVTSLVDSGPGSLREALMATEPRMVLFKVSGTISLKSDIVISEPFVTIAGQTAPGEGIQIRGAQ
ncbi:MAG: hypothetical protein EHM70_21410, partial [Chloroflexota bacterium]